MSRYPSTFIFTTLLFFCIPTGLPERTLADDGVDLYRVRWWGTEGSQYDRPIYQVARLQGQDCELRHVIVRGRPLDDYRLPYWPIRSVVSLSSGQAELTHVPRAIYTLDGKQRTARLVVHEGFDLGAAAGVKVLKVNNRVDESAILFEHLFVVRDDSPWIEVFARATNRGKKTLKDFRQEITYQQDFNWTHFGSSQGDDYRPAVAPAEGDAANFFAFSEGIGRGYELAAGEKCRLRYRLAQEQNRWQVDVAGKAATLGPGESVACRHALRIVSSRPGAVPAIAWLPEKRLAEMAFQRVEPKTWKTAPVDTKRRVGLAEVIASVAKPKTRGLNLRTNDQSVFDDLAAMKQWGANHVILPLAGSQSVQRWTDRAHALGFEVFLQGRGHYDDGSPRFDAFWKSSPEGASMPDSFGQDEDHYYWYAAKPTRDFEADFGHPRARATASEKVLYWSRCFRDKWAGVLRDVREHAPRGNIWFYAPSPGIAHVDPLDQYDLFLKTASELGEPLTVFPFYYGIEYHQAEYMVRRWKDAGAARVVFLPMRGFLVKPSQFLRVITAARRGGADGACGFSFGIGRAEPGDEWQWKSVLLGARADFPTAGLDAYAFLEEPAELLEALAARPVLVDATAREGIDVDAYCRRLDGLLPRGASRFDAAAVENNSAEDAARKPLLIRLGGPELVAGESWPFRFPSGHPATDRGVIQMSGRVVAVCSKNASGLRLAMGLLEQFAELAKAEAGKP